MKKKLVALLMSVTMISGNMVLPVYAEDAETAIEFADDSGADAADLEVEEAEEQDEFNAEIPQEFSDAGEEDFSDHVDEELFSSEGEAAGESRASGGNISWGSSGSILPTDTQTSQEGSVLLGVKGSYITDTQAALARINEIRKEACDEGVTDPRDKNRKLTPSDYVPIRWSSDLEYIARIRAAEASLVIGHTRPNGSRCFTLKSPNGIQAYSEVLAWNGTRKFLPGIEQWYEEKSDWTGNTGGVTGHYTEMIDPDNLYVGLATFINTDAKYSTTTSGEYTSQKNLDETSGPDISDCTQTIEVKTADVTGNMTDFGEELKVPGSVQAEFYATLSGHKLTVLDKVDWKSSDSSVATVDENGLVAGVQTGSADITATCKTLTATQTIKVKAEHQHSWDAGKVTKEATCTEDGVKTYTCTVCNETRTEPVKATGHQGELRGAVEATCKEEGYTGDTVCKVCGEILEKGSTIPKKDHSWDAGKVTKEATCTEDGVKTYTCTACNETKTEPIKATGHQMGAWKTVTAATTQKEGKQERICSACDYKEIKSIPKLKTYTFKITVSKSTVTYNGKTQKPAVTVYAGNKKLSSKYYSVSYKNNKAVGTATITITGKGTYKNYTGKATFRINLQKTAISSIKSTRKGQLQAVWKKTAGNTGYQVQYATNTKFSGAKTKNTTGTNYTFKGLKSKGKYYVRVRTYKKVGGKYWYSGWSSTKSIKIK